MNTLSYPSGRHTLEGSSLALSRKKPLFNPRYRRVEIIEDPWQFKVIEIPNSARDSRRSATHSAIGCACTEKNSIWFPIRFRTKTALQLRLFTGSQECEKAADSLVHLADDQEGHWGEYLFSHCCLTTQAPHAAMLVRDSSFARESSWGEQAFHHRVPVGGAPTRRAIRCQVLLFLSWRQSTASSEFSCAASKTRSAAMASAKPLHLDERLRGDGGSRSFVKRFIL